MKLAQLFEGKSLKKAGCIPYFLEKGEPCMAFMISSDPDFGGEDPQIAKGGVDKGESTQRAGVREAGEELGLRTTNIVDGSLQLGWSGKLEGMESNYKLDIYICQVDDLQDFDKPHYETKEVIWMTEAEFKKKGRKSQRFIVSACAEQIRKSIQ